MARIITVDPSRRLSTLFHELDGGDGFAVENRQDVSEIMEKNRRDFNDSDGVRWGDGRVVARIPLTVWNELEKSGLARDDKALLKWLDQHGIVWKCANVSLSK